MAGMFDVAPLKLARRALVTAQNDLVDVQKNCRIAHKALEECGRLTQAAAVEMICESAVQLEKDIIRWSGLIVKIRNGEN